MKRKKSEPRSATRELVWTEGALADLRSIDEYIAADNPVAAERWVLKLIAAAEAASRAPLAGRVVPEKGRADIREVLVRAYRVAYRVHADRIVIITVFEGSRRFSSSIDVDA